MYRAFPGSDYYEGSLAIGVSPRRQSRVPLTWGLGATILHSMGIVDPSPTVAVWVNLFSHLVKGLVVSLMLRDVVLTRDEVDVLMTGLLTSTSARTGATRFSRWVNDYGDSLGRRHVSELRRSFHSGWPFGDVTGRRISLPCGPNLALLSLHGKRLVYIKESHESGYTVRCG